jgi:hypothetical protein
MNKNAKKTLSDQWSCVHCERVFRKPVAAQIGHRYCSRHPRGFGPGAYPCCGQTSIEAKGCTRCDHVPKVIFDLSPDGRSLVVPTFILGGRSVPAGDGSLLIGSGESATSRRPVPTAVDRLRDTLSVRARLEPAYWTSLGNAVTQKVVPRAEKSVALQEEQKRTQGSLRQQTWEPYVPPPEAPVAAVDARGDDRDAFETAVSMLVRHWSDELPVRAVPGGLLNAEVASELRATAVDFTVVSLTDS